ncbi:MAG TPA: phosphoribosylanthranilate isomerase [Candidatus Polarisedimenticolia bacterium]|nr:phosphoribosylanthranilate isomerase [Candidatus Polarisedimenticolia bacterium]
MRVRVKVCGVTRVEDAAAAVEAGADAIGLNFVDESPRRLRDDRAEAVAAAIPPFVARVGVFANAPVDRIRMLAAGLHLDAAQLHGEENPQECARLTVPWYKAHRVGSDFDPAILAAYGRPIFLLDAAGARRGGTGRTFDWSTARRCASHGRVILAGGLTPENVGEAIAAARPYAVDVNSGVETAPGIKDRDRLRLFCERVAEASARLAGTAARRPDRAGEGR